MVATTEHVRRQCDRPAELPATPHEKFDFYSNAIMVAVGHLAKTVVSGKEESERMKAALALIALEKARLRHKGEISGAREKPGYVCELEPLPDFDEELASPRAKRDRAASEGEAPRRVGRTEPGTVADAIRDVPSEPRGGPPSDDRRWASARNGSPDPMRTDGVAGPVRPTRRTKDASPTLPAPNDPLPNGVVMQLNEAREPDITEEMIETQRRELADEREPQRCPDWSPRSWWNTCTDEEYADMMESHGHTHDTVWTRDGPKPPAMTLP